ncbi:MAG: restriction endonuclease subunit S, partial [Mycoplasmoidaceae bacterium]
MINSNIANYKKIWEVTLWDKKFQEVENFKQKNVFKISYMSSKNLKDIFVNDFYDADNSNVRILSTGKFDGFTSIEKAGKYLHNDEVITIPGGGKAIIKYHNGYFVTTDNRVCKSFNENVLLTKYLYYFFIEKNKLIEKFYRGSSIKHPNMKSILEMEINIPPIHIQKRAIKILDKFDELTRELTNRKKQYKYYMNYLINCETNNIKKIWEVTFWDRK